MFRVIAVIALILIYIQNSDGLFKMTNVHCESYNPSWVVINKCRLRAVRRDVSKFYLNVTILKPAFKIEVNQAFVKKANGYKPYLLNITLGVCDYVKRRNNPFFNLIYDLYKEYSNINHTCPYVGDQIIDGLVLKHEAFRLPLPNGEYGLLITWYFSKVKMFITNVYFDFALE